MSLPTNEEIARDLRNNGGSWIVEICDGRKHPVGMLDLSKGDANRFARIMRARNPRAKVRVIRPKREEQ